MIEIKFNPWQCLIDLVVERWPDLKAEVYFTETEWDWTSFPSGTIWYQDDSDVALIRVSNRVPFLETMDILAKSLAYLACAHDTGKILDLMGQDASAEVYYNWIYDEYNRRIAEKDGLYDEGDAGEAAPDAHYGCEPAKNIA